jgi:hypothetical protein
VRGHGFGLELVAATADTLDGRDEIDHGHPGDVNHRTAIRVARLRARVLSFYQPPTAAQLRRVATLI